MSSFSDDDIKKIWEKGIIVDNLDPNKYRLDAAGALMKWDHRNEDDDYDWEIDHVLSKHMMEQLGIPEKDWNKPENLRPFNAKNNAKKSDEYPRYTRKLVYDEESKTNIEKETRMVVNEKVQKGINACYNLSFRIVTSKPQDKKNNNE